jgi:hypothetical protein
VNPDSTCAATDWSPWATAAPLSQLAGVLAAVVFAGIVLVLTIPNPGTRGVGTLQFFFAGFVVLGMDSFAFALLAGDTSTICTRVWIEFIASCGMLVVGACSVINGIAWLMATCLRPQDGTVEPAPMGNSITRLELSLMWAIHGITFVTLVLLSTSAMDYINTLWRNSPIPRWKTMVGTVTPYLLIVGVASGMILRIAPSRNSSSISSRALLGIIGYSLVASLVVGITTSTSASIWAGMPKVISILLLAVLVIPPVPILVAMAQANPELSAKQPVSQERDDTTVSPFRS